LGELLVRYGLFFSNLPEVVRTSILIGCGLVLTRLAIPRFQHEFIAALAYIVLAVFLFWMAIATFI
jgi:hypothetical protein